jgi:alcohol dehydrogenase class IV
MYNVSHGKALGFLIPPVCRIMGFTSCSSLEKLNDFVEFDTEVITHEAQQYPKFFNTKNKVDINQLIQELNNEKNNLLN